jgi:hypothetical protein
MLEPGYSSSNLYAPSDALFKIPDYFLRQGQCSFWARILPVHNDANTN